MSRPRRVPSTRCRYRRHWSPASTASSSKPRSAPIAPRASSHSASRRASERQLSSFPDAEQAANEHQLADVIRVVIQGQYQLAEVGLAAAVRNLRLEIEAGVGRELLHRLPI